MSVESGVVIIGAGAAGHGCARTLRAEGFAGRIRLVNGEIGPPVNRTLVDKGVLPGLLTGEQIALPPLPDVELIDGRATSWSPRDRVVELAGGERLGGDAIVIACGSAPRALDVEIDPVVPVHAMHTVADAERLRAALAGREGARIAVLGAGFIGAEIASHCAATGVEVVLIGRSGQPLRSAVGAEASARLADLHRERVDARFGVGVRAVRAGGAGERAVRVELDDGSAVAADAVVVAVGSRPDAEWAGFDGAIPVDDHLRFPDTPGVYAAGGAASVSTPWGPLRIDHWDAAAAQGAHAARTVLHDLGLGADPGAYLPTTGFTLMAHGAVVAARGARVADAVETAVDLDRGGVLTEFVAPDGTVTGVAGWNAGASVAGWSGPTAAATASGIG